ncbi:glycoside hydrolase N-terminal domain-containing protein [Streptomyces sp. NPDC056716]|uniref:glycosyl hydrolase family 95 catalytic domain-containing protein n=1 Tax=unclassified Streptomyces TaxID=2593676 RepID=UPI0036B5D391
MQAPRPTDSTPPSRRNFLALTGAGAAGTLAVLAGIPPFRAAAAEPVRPVTDPSVPTAEAVRIWYTAPASRQLMLQQGLPIGNGRLGALVTGDPAGETLYITDASMWTGGRNSILSSDGQFPYDRTNFGSLTQLAHLTVDIPDHALGSVTGYERALDLSNGLQTTTYVHQGVTYRREVYASRPDDSVVVSFTQSGGGTYTGRILLTGTHGETVTTDVGDATASFGAALPGGRRYGGAVTAVSRTGNVQVGSGALEFTDCADLTVVFSGGTDYAPDFAQNYRDPSIDPQPLARSKATAAAALAAGVLRRTHVADYRALFSTMEISLGTSTEAQRSSDTWSRLHTRAGSGAAPDPELEASYLQYGRYLMICGSRDGLPMGLQGSWIDSNEPGWMGDYHTDVNIQMNYWMADRTGLPSCFDALTDYCLAQLPSWTENTQRLFNDPRNRFRNSSEKVAGWTVGISTNIDGGSGWQWHPAGSAWLANSLFDHYEYRNDPEFLARIYPLVKGACEFWEARLIPHQVTDHVTGETREALVADKDWSPEHGPQDALGITYAQELVWTLFTNYRTATQVLGRDSRYRKTIDGLRRRLYLPQVSPTTGWLEEWLTPDNLGEVEHRHLSPLMGLFPGDRIDPDTSPAALVAGVRKLLQARGTSMYGWANAWRALCWARFREGETAYEKIIKNLAPFDGRTGGTALNLFDTWPLDANSSICQVDSNFGTPSAMVGMLVHSRPGSIELLPALPAAWAERGRITGVGARGGFTVDLSWRDGVVEKAVIRSVGGRSTEVVAGGKARSVRLARGESVTLRW